MIWTPGIESNLPSDVLSDNMKAQLSDLHYASWLYTVAERPTDQNATTTSSRTAERLATFRWAHFRLRSRPHMVMSEALAFWSSYLARLYITRARYITACQDYAEIVTAVRAGIAANNDVVPPALVVAQFGLEDRLRLEIETFYVSTKLLLERIALTFGFYFNRPVEESGSAHHRLTEHFKKWSSSISQGQKTPIGLHRLMRDLSKRVVSFRNVHIEHPSSPLAGVRHWPSTQYSTDGTPYVSVEAYSADSQPLVKTENPADIIALVEEYIDKMLTYFETYRHASTFGPAREVP